VAVTLQDLGWNEHFSLAYRQLGHPEWIPARLIRETKINFTALGANGDEYVAIVSGKLWHEASCDAELPAVGDWVAIEPANKVNDQPVIRAILPRQSKFSRKTPGKSTAEQVIATNVDVVVVVTDAVGDFNLRRLERYFTLIGRSGARAVVLVNKCDQVSKLAAEKCAVEVRRLYPQAEVHCISALKGSGLKILHQLLKKGLTMTLVGSSGVGKSTLINQLLGDEFMWTGEVNSVTGKGRHTTTARELVLLKRGGMLIDNPGIREVQMWSDANTLLESFSDLQLLASQCRYSDCKHKSDAGCAIAAAVASGKLAQERYDSFLHLDEEIAELKRKQMKRQMVMERVNKREAHERVRNFADRQDIKSRHNPQRWRGKHEY